MSHYHRRAGLCAPLLPAPFLRAMMGCICLFFSASSIAQAPASGLSASQRTNPNFVLIPDRGNVSVLKLDDQLRVGKPISDNQALTFTFSDSIEGIVDREMKLKGRAQIRRNDSVLKADEIIYHPDTDIADLIGNVEISKGNSSFRGPKASFKVDARQGEMEQPSYEISDNRSSGKAKK
jgi:LPS-assembly protein